MASFVKTREKFWNNKEYRIGANKSCLFINRLPNDLPLKQMNFPFYLMSGDFIGFQGITDCFWEIYNKDMKYLVSMIIKYNIKKLNLISKIPITNEQISILLPIKDRLTICYSVTGLDEYEKTKTKDRINSLIKLRNKNFDVLPVMHPYIYGVSDFKKVFDLLKKYDFTEINWKGFRYDSNMKNLKLPKSILEIYNNDNEDKEIIYKEEELYSYAKQLGLVFVDLKEYLHRTNSKYNYNVTKEKAIEDVNNLFSNFKIVISSSDSKKNVIKNTIERRII